MGIPVRLAGIGSYLPPQVRSNDSFDYRAAGVSPERVERAGVVERRWAAPDQTILDLAEQACTRALRCAGLAPGEVDRLILVTSTLQPSLIVPTGAAVLQDRLGMARCQATTVVETCCGALVAMDLAAGLIRSGQARHVVVVAAETFSKTFNPSSRVTCEIGMSMGDGAGAVVLGREQETDSDGLVASYLRSGGEFQSGLGMRPTLVDRDGQPGAVLAFGAAGAPTLRGQPLSHEGLVEALQRFTTVTVPAAIREVLAEAGMQPGQIDFFLLHQPNAMFLRAWRQEAQIPAEKTLDTLERFGNLSSVSVLVNLDLAYQRGCLRRGDTFLLASAGEGACWGAMIWKWPLGPNPAHAYLLEGAARPA